jgi:hypothetical protein
MQQDGLQQQQQQHDAAEAAAAAAGTGTAVAAGTAISLGSCCLQSHCKLSYKTQYYWCSQQAVTWQVASQSNSQSNS